MDSPDTTLPGEHLQRVLTAMSWRIVAFMSSAGTVLFAGANIVARYVYE